MINMEPMLLQARATWRRVYRDGLLEMGTISLTLKSAVLRLDSIQNLSYFIGITPGSIYVLSNKFSASSGSPGFCPLHSQCHCPWEAPPLRASLAVHWVPRPGELGDSWYPAPPMLYGHWGTCLSVVLVLFFPIGYILKNWLEPQRFTKVFFETAF